MKIITNEFLKEKNACSEGVKWVNHQKLIGLPLNLFIKELIKTNENEKLQWANWLIVRCMNKKQKVQYAIFAAELVLNIFEKKYPNDDRPKKAIKTAKNYLKRPGKKIKAAAADAYAAAYAAADAAAYAAADAAAAYAAAYAAAAAAYAAADAAAYAAAAAAYADAAAAAANAAIKILKFGLTFFK